MIPEATMTSRVQCEFRCAGDYERHESQPQQEQQRKTGGSCFLHCHTLQIYNIFRTQKNICACCNKLAPVCV